MKKLVLFIGLTVLAFGAFAEKTPSIVVNKQQGGFSALFNLYNYVQYTPAELTSTGIGELNCAGNGFSACRVPNCTSLPVINGNSVINITDAAKVNAFLAAANEVIGQYEAALEQCQNAPDSKVTNSKGASVPSVYTKTVAMKVNNNSKTTETYVVRGVVTASTTNSSTMKIYIEKVSLF